MQSEECHELFKKNQMIIHIETGNIFFDNVNSNSGESIYDFFIAQQDYTKKLLIISEDYEVNNLKYL